MDNGGNLWVGTPSGIAMFDGENWKKFDESNGLRQASIHSIKAKGTAVWVGSVGGTVSRYKDGQWKLFEISISMKFAIDQSPLASHTSNTKFFSKSFPYTE